MKTIRIFLCLVLCAALLAVSVFAMPGESIAVLGGDLTVAEADSMYALFGAERGTAMEQTLSREDAAASFSDVPEGAARTAVYLTVLEGGAGLSVSLTNISCAETVFAAALAAAGLTDVSIKAAAAEAVEPLAVLPAVFRAYETITCLTVSPEAREAAASALRETREITENLTQELDLSRLEEILGTMDSFFDELAALDESELPGRIQSIAAEKGIPLNDSQAQQLADLFRKLQKLREAGLSEQVQKLPGTVESAANTAVSFWQKAKAFFRKAGEWISQLFNS